jgi:DNA ligase-1
MKFKKLYQRALKGKINTWEIEVENNKYRTITGFDDGKKTTSDWQVCEAKNVGKKNATTADEQAVKEAQALYDKKLELGYFEDVNNIDNSTLFKPMLAHKYEDVDITFPCYTQPKLDGIRCIIKADGMWTRNGKKIVSCPHVFEQLEVLFETYPHIIFDGELYNHEFKHDFNKITSLVKKTKPTSEDLEESKQLIQYHIYDLPSSSNGFIDRLEEMLGIIPEVFPFASDLALRYVTTKEVNNQEELDKLYHEWMGEGYEGQMIRVSNSFYENKRSKSLLKRKEFEDDEFEILGVHEGSGKLSGRVGTMTFRSKSGHEFTSTVNGTQEYLDELWSQRDELVGKLATIKYFNLTPGTEIPRFPKVISIRDFE